MIRLITIALLLLGGAYAYAASPTAPTLRTAQQGDTVRVVAAWRPVCDVRGCSDSSRIVWRWGTQSVTRTTRHTADTLWVAAPAWDDSLRVAIEVATIRRRLASDVRTASVIVRRLDAPPPPVDSLRVDTLELRRQLAEIAVRDSFPLIVSRDSLGRSEGDLPLFGELRLCAIGRNRYTGTVAVIVEWEVPADVANAIQRRCDHARAVYASERSG